jgi:multisubunit Na+/H+ antiporter MnhE subunit
MKEWADFIKSIIRPFIIVWGFLVYGICVMTEVEIPQLLAGLITAVIIEYFGERAMKRLKEKP